MDWDANWRGLTRFLRSYKYDTEGVCTCAALYDGWWDRYSDESCHGFTQDLERFELIGIATATINSDDRFEEIAEEYFCWIVNGEDSPWRNARQQLIYHEGTLVGIFTPADQNYQLAMNAMVAIRTPWERPNKLRAWKVFQRNGFTPVESLYLCSHFWFGGITWKKAIDHPHTPIEPYQDVSLKKLATASPTMWPNNNFNVEGTEYTPLTYIWDRDNDLRRANRYMYDGPNHRLYKICQKDSPYEGEFKKLFASNINRDLVFKDNGLPSHDELMQILHDNREVWDDRDKALPDVQEGQAA